jgi:competence protein ComEC
VHRLGNTPRIAAAIAFALRPVSAAAMLGGTLLVQCMSTLPSRSIDALIAAAGLLLCLFRRWRLLGICTVGIAWTALRADIALSQRLPRALENDDIVVTGTVHDLPQSRNDATRFEFVVESASHDGEALAWSGLIRLGWYETAPEVGACERWRLHVKLKRPRATINPGGFDAERYALEHGIVAVGAVRDSSDNEKLDRTICINSFRTRIVNTISTALDGSTSADLLRALAFGDQHAMSTEEWSIARATGIPHLIAISGLHIALFASFGVGLMRLLLKCAPTLTLRWPAPLMEAVASLVFAVAYALIAGFGLPTRRALVMIAALLIANLTRRAHAPVHGLALAVVVLLVADPLCVLSAGFWLSFVGVGWLMLCLQGPRRHHWRDMIRSQGVATVGLLPLGIWFFGQSSLIAPLANLVAVPVICFFVLPLGTLGALIGTFWPTIGFPLLSATGFVLDGLWSLLESMSHMPGALWYFAEPTLPAFVLAIAGAFWLLQPRGLPARAVGALLFLPMLTPIRAPLLNGAFDFHVLDVGQGLAMIVRTANHTLVYDTGPLYPSGFDLGAAAVIPALHALGIDRLDRLIVSHGDSDHAGGAAAVVAAFASGATESGEPERLKIPASQCLAGERWNWDGVTFRIVSPKLPLDAHGNDRCCVLDIRSGDNELLLSGDITAAVESDVASSLAPIAEHVVLQAPHHGSKTSSSDAFLDALHPRLTIFSTGYLNRFHHPNADIVERYAAKHLPTLDTTDAGFVHIVFDQAGPPLLERGRIDRHPYWRE